MADSLLATNPAFRRYWLARLISYAGDQVARTALLIAVFDRDGAAAVGLLLLASTAPRLVGVPRVPAANAQIAIGVNIGVAAGPALGGLLLATTGLTTTLLVNAGSFVGSALLIAGVP